MITLKGITWDHPRGYAPLIAASRLYEQSRGVRVVWEKRSLTAFGDESLEALSRRYDLLIIDHPHVGGAMEAGWLLPLEEMISADILETLAGESAGPSFPSYRYGGHQWALPVDAAVQCAAVRPDLMEERPLPRDWEEVFALGAGLRARGRWLGMALCPTDCSCTFLTLTAQLGSPLTGEGPRLVDPATGLEALGMLRRLRTASHPGSLGWSPVDLLGHMSTEDDIPYTPLAFGYTHYSRVGDSRKRLTFGDAPGPGGALLGGAGIAVSSAGRHPLAAADYAAWIAGAAVQGSVYLENEGQPANLTVWEDEGANRFTGGFFRDTLPTLRSAQVRPRYPGWPAFQREMGEMLNRFLALDSSPRKVLDELEERFRLFNNTHPKN
jgi:multiple sugar transport system substrate-binding protein